MPSQDSNTHAILQDAPKDFALSDVNVRLIKPTKQPRFDAVMNDHHDLGFCRLTRHGLRSVALFAGVWLGLATWQNGAFKYDRWIGWTRDLLFDRLDLSANTTRFLVLSELSVLPYFATFFLQQMPPR